MTYHCINLYRVITICASSFIPFALSTHLLSFYTPQTKMIGDITEAHDTCKVLFSGNGDVGAFVGEVVGAGVTGTATGEIVMGDATGAEVTDGATGEDLSNSPSFLMVGAYVALALFTFVMALLRSMKKKNASIPWNKVPEGLPITRHEHHDVTNLCRYT